ncbi:hypothetical protein HOP50_19g83320 [Chloropicon primus]|uniref:Uncharacterized protein n=1 Tax=Chloropicon primus TaxID=1764295 RepID=A0A5B8N1S1_9CHLO|nr:hypothetical protein A3770_19p83080 [Chloropicon primus]UPR04985.1 hypothetical protein HOP50_19g83320 [Chloropicon primus]|eukprot:QDZ25790.1 hypothetical protein A3770_19p83080 [Chloropicon primus]
MRPPSLRVACDTIRSVILERKGSPKDVVLAVHRLNQVLAKARTFAELEDLVTTVLVTPQKGAEGRGGKENAGIDADSLTFLQILVDVVVSGKPEAYPILCLLNTLSLVKESSDSLARLQVPLILKAVTKGSVEEASAQMANKIIRTMEKQK